jgi:hypothetical protein
VVMPSYATKAAVTQAVRYSRLIRPLGSSERRVLPAWLSVIERASHQELFWSAPGSNDIPARWPMAVGWH